MFRHLRTAKGATSTMILQMDKWLAYYAALAREQFPHADAKYPGAGAAGGMGFAFLTFCNATLESGIKIILEETHLEKYIRDADVVITGEGRLDGQTVMGKAPIGVAKIAKNMKNRYLLFPAAWPKRPLPATQRALMPFPDSAERGIPG